MVPRLPFLAIMLLLPSHGFAQALSPSSANATAAASEVPKPATVRVSLQTNMV